MHLLFDTSQVGAAVFPEHVAAVPHLHTPEEQVSPDTAQVTDAHKLTDGACVTAGAAVVVVVGLSRSSRASKSPTCPATPPNATMLAANRNRSCIGIPKNCRSMLFDRGFPLNRSNSCDKRFCVL